jgi:hypothetical protein
MHVEGPKVRSVRYHDAQSFANEGEAGVRTDATPPKMNSSAPLLLETAFGR